MTDRFKYVLIRDEEVVGVGGTLEAAAEAATQNPNAVSYAQLVDCELYERKGWVKFRLVVGD